MLYIVEDLTVPTYLILYVLKIGFLSTNIPSLTVVNVMTSNRKKTMKWVDRRMNC